MSDRGLSSALATAVALPNVRFLVFVKLEFDSGTIYLHNGVGTYSWDSASWIGIGGFGGISGVSESTTLSPYEIDLVLSGLDADLLDEVLNQQYYLRPVTLYIGALDVTAGTLVADPDEIWRGAMDTARISLGDDNALMVTCESEFAIFEKTNGSVFSDSDLQNDYSGDLFLKWAAATEDVELKWGDASAITTGTGRNGGYVNFRSLGDFKFGR